MAEALKVYSVVIVWNDDNDEGTYGDTVRARDSEHAERIVRARMMRSMWAEWRRDKTMTKSDIAELYATPTYDGVQYFGECVECSEGASWKAVDMEKALRALALACQGHIRKLEPHETDEIAAPLQEALKVIAEIDAI
ncbi:hypothetical protein MPL3356_60558 [Mesorhizobium plurifarium]|uniref:Uncharacterized protein n=1 Tax=Mesorhizobium plurifarium TaxID=69974 RepID=A0A090G742_MESPL|nr:hypothetical protein MPL3356_60558 [Mesorhizobium plurifarium]